MARLAFDTRGEGAHTVLLLHGFLGSGRNLASLARRWVEREPRLRVVMPDLTGHGSSPPPPEAPTLGDVASDVLELAATSGADEPLTIVGHSFGGRVALKMRALAPDRVGALVLLDITPGALPEGIGNVDGVLARVLAAPARVAARDEMRRYFLDAGISPALTDWVLLNLTQDSGGLRWRLDREKIEALHASSSREDLWPLVDARVRCVRGERSSFVSDADAARLRGLGCEVVTLAGAGHFVHVDAQAALLEALVGFSL
jgi:esterase